MSWSDNKKLLLGAVIPCLIILISQKKIEYGKYFEFFIDPIIINQNFEPSY